MHGFDRLLYLIVLVGFVLSLMQATRETRGVEPSGPDLPFQLPGEGAPLPDPSFLDPDVVVDLPTEVGPSTGTAFSVGSGVWLTARHVVEGCAEVGLLTGRQQGVRAQTVSIAAAADVAVVEARLQRPSFPVILDPDALAVGDWGYHIGYPQGRPGEVATRLMGREVLVTRGRMTRRSEPVLGWAETSRSSGLLGSLGGLSGGPAFTADGAAAGVVVAESPRRGRIYTAAPRSVDQAVRDAAVSLSSSPSPAQGLSPRDYPRAADTLRRELRVAQVLCTGPH